MSKNLKKLALGAKILYELAIFPLIYRPNTGVNRLHNNFQIGDNNYEKCFYAGLFEGML